MLAQTERLIDHGIAGLMLCILIGAIGTIALWLKPKADKVVEKHLELIDTLRVQVVKQTLALEQTLGNQAVGHAELKKVIELNEKIISLLQKEKQ